MFNTVKYTNLPFRQSYDSYDVFRFARHKMFVVIVFSINYGIKVKFLCGDNSTEYGYEAFMLEKLVFMEKLENLYSYLYL